MRYLNPSLILLPTLLFLLIGLRWLIEPAAVTPDSDLIWGKVWAAPPKWQTLQVFLTGSLCGIAALITQNQPGWYPP